MRGVLKYPGSKWLLAKEFVSMIPEHHSYVEPYFGSGAILFNKPISDIETVNDLDSDVTNLFRCIRQDSERIARIVAATPYSREEYDNQYLDNHGQADPFQKAVSFLIRSWQGHGFRTGKYKGGWKKDVIGRERAYALWSWYRLPEWIIDVAERLRRVQIENRPALEVIEGFNREGVFMYIDPPYLLETRKAHQYKYEMTDAEHVELLEMLLKSKAKIMLSGYDSDLYDDYLKNWEKRMFDSHTEYGKKRKEVVWLNYEGNQMSLFDIPGIMP